MKTICFNQHFEGHHLHYQVHFNTNRKLFPRIDKQFAKYTNKVSNSNKEKLSKFYNGHRETKIETIPGSKYSYEVKSITFNK